MTDDLFQSALKNVNPEIDIFVKYAFDIADRIHFLMERNQLSGVDLAKKLGKHPSEISRYLSGTHNFTLQTLAKLEAALGENIIRVEIVTENASKDIQGIEEHVSFPIKEPQIYSFERLASLVRNDEVLALPKQYSVLEATELLETINNSDTTPYDSKTQQSDNHKWAMAA